jgi:hypothetical chaperone protein
MKIGIDFGTTNSSVAVARDGVVEMASFAYSGGLSESFRSVLYLELVRQAGGLTGVKSWAGNPAIDKYLAAETKGRLIQSLKSFLSSRLFQKTEVQGRMYTLEDLIARILREIREQAEQQFQIPIRAVTAGRPVRFAGSDKEDDDKFAVSRLEKAYLQAGFQTVRFELEPVAAAQYYEARLDHDELILIGDFGGGTSDFSLLRAGPGIRKRGRLSRDLLGNAGLGFAGDAFDARIIRQLVSPALGAGSQIDSMGKILPAPTWVYSKLERWHQLSFLRTRETLNMLESVRAQSLEPEKIEALLHIVNEDLGYQLHRAVQRMKCELSAASQARFHFTDGTVEIDAMVSRAEFERWIGAELLSIEGCVDLLVERSGVGRKDVDMVFLTGGSSFVPAVRKIFVDRFGEDRIQSGNEFTSVARGLALIK